MSDKKLIIIHILLFRCLASEGKFEMVETKNSFSTVMENGVVSTAEKQGGGYASDKVDIPYQEIARHTLTDAHGNNDKYNIYKNDLSQPKAEEYERPPVISAYRLHHAEQVPILMPLDGNAPRIYLKRRFLPGILFRPWWDYPGYGQPEAIF